MAETTLYKTSLNKSMALCSRREYCISDILAKLDSWGVGKDDAGRIIKNLLKEKFIDEERYATAFVKDKFRYNKWGKIRIGLILKMKGIPADIIKLALESIEYEDYRRMLEDLISSHRRKIKAKNQYDLKAKLMRFGLSKGFESPLIYEILGEGN
jgi:regulatory protein